MYSIRFRHMALSCVFAILAPLCAQPANSQAQEDGPYTDLSNGTMQNKVGDKPESARFGGMDSAGEGYIWPVSDRASAGTDAAALTVDKLLGDYRGEGRE